MQRRVVVVGPLFLDVALGPVRRMPNPGEEIWTGHSALVPGGSAIQAIALSRLGLDVELFAYVGADLAGRFVLAGLREEGVGTDSLVEVPRQSVTAAISVGTDRAMVSAGTDQAPPLSGDAPAALVADLKAVRANYALVKKWRAKGTLIIGDVGWDETGCWNRSDLDVLDTVDIFVPNEEEASHYTRRRQVRQILEELGSKVPAVVVTRGADGLVAAERGKHVSLQSLPAQAVDPTGAGDTFTAGLAWGLLNGGNLHQAASVGALAATLGVEKVGGSNATPTLAELRQRVARLDAAQGYDFSLLGDSGHEDVARSDTPARGATLDR